MKKILTIGLLGLAMVLNVKGQGQVDFRNSNLTGSRFVFDVDGTTKLAGPAFAAQLYYSTTQNGTYVPVAAPSVAFRNVGAGDGFWNPGASSARNIPGTLGNQSVFLIVRAWNTAAGATWEAASLNADGRISSPNAVGFAYTLGGDPGDGSPAVTAPAMNGFQSFSLVPVPEPSTIALGILGAGSLLFLRRKK